MHRTGEYVQKQVDKLVDFGRKYFASMLRSRRGALSEMALLLRFQTGTEGFNRTFKRLIPLMRELKEAYYSLVRTMLPDQGLTLGIIDDSSVEKSGKTFPKQQYHHDHENDSFYSGMRVLTSAIYRNGKFAAISSSIVGKEDNKLDTAQKDAAYLIAEFMVDLILMDSWYCKKPFIDSLRSRNVLFISRLRRDTLAEFDEDAVRLDALAKGIPHKQYEMIKIEGKTYWIVDLHLALKTYGNVRVIISKDSQHGEPVFLVTNATKFSAKFVVKLYLRRFAIEVFYRDVKQFLNFETFMCRSQDKWDLHLHLVNVLHFAMQKRNSISKTVREIREDIDKCRLYINKNGKLIKFLAEFASRTASCLILLKK